MIFSLSQSDSEKERENKDRERGVSWFTESILEIEFSGFGYTNKAFFFLNQTHEISWVIESSFPISKVLRSNWENWNHSHHKSSTNRDNWFSVSL